MQECQYFQPTVKRYLISTVFISFLLKIFCISLLRLPLLVLMHSISFHAVNTFIHHTLAFLHFCLDAVVQLCLSACTIKLNLFDFILLGKKRKKHSSHMGPHSPIGSWHPQLDLLVQSQLWGQDNGRGLSVQPGQTAFHIKTAFRGPAGCRTHRPTVLSAAVKVPSLTFRKLLLLATPCGC